MQIKAGYGSYEASERRREIHKTQKAIKAVLKERWDAWEDARALALEDPDIKVTEFGTEYMSPRQLDEEGERPYSAGERAGDQRPKQRYNML